ERGSHYVWPAPLDKADTPGGRLLAGRDYQPSGSSRRVPTLGTWPLLYDLSRDSGEAYNVADLHPEKGSEMQERLTAFREAFRSNPRGWRTAQPRAQHRGGPP
ncbi:MAG: hypothetical protein GY944_15095, partial [bacterium]|nr:hypothetical protein [bacterium]